jgi:hypothetical protein
VSASIPFAPSFDFFADGDRLVAAEPFAHVDHAALAFAVAFLQLLALGRHGFQERRAETVGWLVAVDHDTLGFLEALRQRSSCENVFSRWGGGWRGWSLLMSLQELGMIDSQLTVL